MAVCRTASIAWPTWPISSLPTRIGGASAATSTDSPRRSRATTAGSCSLRQRQRGRAQLGQPPVDGPAEQDRDQQREDEADRADALTAHSRRLASIAGVALAASTVVGGLGARQAGGVQPRRGRRCCHDAGVTPSCSISRSGAPDMTACWIVGQVALHRRRGQRVQGGVVGLELGRGEQLLVQQRVVLLPSGRLAEGHPVVGRQRSARQRAGQQRVLLRHVLLGVHGGDQAKALLRAGRVGDAARLGLQHRPLPGDDVGVVRERGRVRVSFLAGDLAPQRGQAVEGWRSSRRCRSSPRRSRCPWCPAS